ncbi:LysR family transcriptional regulator [Agaricicola taiwanensis]|uniref:LysR family transcriptional regulator n=1 Tax=Agaricicola taiwanensis TaxID=591372 RepID=A0A8J2VEJ6_9RHOB|nr:LysR family transcriptional regulator [Agaricicola taiwanensis]GGE27278.1 LysR family transcriptional regulator [Agaricicola taiwanensis]
MASLDIALLRSFVAVSRTGSISGAALQVGRTQSAVSMQMRRLETVIGRPILHRTGTGVGLTATGDRLLAYAEKILSAHDEAVADLSGTGLQGAISFGCPEDYLTAFVPDLLKGFTELNDKVEIEVVCAPTVELRHLLHRRRIDVALISLPEDSDPGAIIRPESFVWVANAPASELLQHKVTPLALSAPDTLDHRAACNAMDRAGKAYRIAFASNSLAGLLAIARSGQAISVITRSAMPDDLYVLGSPMPPLPGIGISMAYASVRPSAAVRAFGEFVKNNLRLPARAG